VHREALATCALTVGVQKSKHINVCNNIINIHAEIAKHKNKAQVKLKSIQSKKAAVRQISCNVYSRKN
jgi:hypothetical protein